MDWPTLLPRESGEGAGAHKQASGKTKGAGVGRLLPKNYDFKSTNLLGVICECVVLIWLILILNGGMVTRKKTSLINNFTGFLAALSSSWSLVVGPSVGRSVRPSVGPSVYLCEKVIFRVSKVIKIHLRTYLRDTRPWWMWKVGVTWSWI